ncbi:MAG: hypothetical protein R6X02_22985 [Enhygromyxa sp.]
MTLSTVSKCALVALFCSFACFVEDSDLPEIDAADPIENFDEAEVEAEAEAEADDFRVSWECAGGELNTRFVSRPYIGVRGIPADPFYCLTLCEGHRQVSRANRESVRDPSRRTDSWCLAHAAYYCSRLRRELEGWCWGMRD